MKYIRKELILADICDETINDLKVIKGLFETLKEEQFDISVVYFAESGEIPLNYDKVRITAVHEDAVDISVYKNNSVLKQKNIPIGAFLQVKVIANKSHKNLLIQPGQNTLNLDIS